MVIFGAGASRDSVSESRIRSWPSDQHRPPLARELFDDREIFAKAMRDYPTSAELIRQLRSVTATVPLETELERLTNESQTSPGLRRELAALRFYLRSVIWESTSVWERAAPGQSNYNRLLRRLNTWLEANPREGLALVTFNYDLMLDHAVQTTIGRIDLSNIDGYVADRRIKVFKPHGSVNWARVVGDSVPTSQVNDARAESVMIDWAANKDGLPLAANIVVSPSPISLRKKRTWSEMLFPSLTVPMQSKPFEFPDAHATELNAALESTTKLLVIGWRATESHFLKLLRTVNAGKPVPVQAACGSIQGAVETIRVLDQQGIVAKTLPFPGGFTHFIESDSIGALLAD